MFRNFWSRSAGVTTLVVLRGAQRQLSPHAGTDRASVPHGVDMGWARRADRRGTRQGVVDHRGSASRTSKWAEPPLRNARDVRQRGMPCQLHQHSRSPRMCNSCGALPRRTAAQCRKCLEIGLSERMHAVAEKGRAQSQSPEAQKRRSETERRIAAAERHGTRRNCPNGEMKLYIRARFCLRWRP